MDYETIMYGMPAFNGVLLIIGALLLAFIIYAVRR